MKVLMTLVLVLLLAGCAAGQGGAGQTPAEETTANGKEETTIQQGAGGNLPRPPDSTLSYGGQEVKGSLGTYCWFSDGSGGCADAPPITPPRKRTLTVPSGSEMVFRYGGQNPPDKVNATAFSLNKKGQLRLPPSHKKGQPGPLTTPTPLTTGYPLEAHGSGVDKTIPVELPPGEYLLDVFLREQQNDASYFFRIMVE